MEINKINIFIVIDDEDSILTSLKSLISKTFLNAIVYTARDGTEGWNLIQKHHPNVVICDLAMPGLSGMQVLQRVRENKNLNDIYFIVLTVTSDKIQRIKALEEGADDFIVKPFHSDELIARIKSANRFIGIKQKSIEENKLLIDLAKELEQDIEDMQLLAINFIQARYPASVEICQRVAAASLWIAQHLMDEEEDEDIDDIKIASYLCYSGKVFLPDSLVKSPVMIDGKVSNNLMYQVPVSAKEIISSVRRFKDVAKILYHLYENFDGSGFPARLRSWQIPLGSRIIRVVLDYEELKIQTKQISGKVLSQLQHEGKRLYDHRVITLLEQYLAINTLNDTSMNERALSLQDLEEGMIISRDIITNSGLKLMPAGAVLRQETIKKLLAHNSSDPIIGNIIVKS